MNTHRYKKMFVYFYVEICEDDGRFIKARVRIPKNQWNAMVKKAANSR